MAHQKESGTKESIIGFVIIALIIGAIIWGIVAVLRHPKQTDTTSKTKTSQAASMKPEVASGNEKLQDIMSELKRKYPNANNSYIFTTNKDPYNGLNKPHSYTAGAAFCDNYDTLYTPNDTSDTGGSANAYGFECGGTVEVFDNATDAASEISALKRVTTQSETGKCLTTSQGNSECSYELVGDCVVHVSDVLTDSQQEDFLQFLSTEITSVNL